MRGPLLVCLLVAWSGAARAEEAAPVEVRDAAPAAAGDPASAPASPEPAISPAPALETSLDDVRRLLFEEAEFERGAAELEARRAAASGWSRADLAAVLELEAYVRFGLGEEDRWTRALLELATVDPSHVLPDTFPLPLVRTLAELGANARSLVLTLDVRPAADRLEVLPSLLHDVGALARRLVVRARRLGRSGEPWVEHELTSGPLVLVGEPGAELELEAVAFGPQDVELARSSIELVSVPRRVEVWEEWPFWVVLGTAAAALAVVLPVSVWAASQPPALVLGEPTCSGSCP